jgi:hypothetical protein
MKDLERKAIASAKRLLPNISKNDQSKYARLNVMAAKRTGVVLSIKDPNRELLKIQLLKRRIMIRLMNGYVAKNKNFNQPSNK